MVLNFLVILAAEATAIGTRGASGDAVGVARIVVLVCNRLVATIALFIYIEL